MRSIHVVAAVLGGTLVGVLYVARGGRAAEREPVSGAVNDTSRERAASPETSAPKREALEGLSASPPTSPVAGGPSELAAASMRESLQRLREKVAEPVLCLDLDAGFLEKYRGMDAQDLLEVYPYLLEIHEREMRATLRQALDSGAYVTEVLEAGTRVDLEKYKEPGATFQTVASHTESLGNGLTEHKIVPIDRVHFPAMYSRDYEQIWVHEKIDEAGICTMCSSPPPSNVKVTTRPR